MAAEERATGRVLPASGVANKCARHAPFRRTAAQAVPTVQHNPTTMIALVDCAAAMAPKIALRRTPVSVKPVLDAHLIVSASAEVSQMVVGAHARQHAHLCAQTEHATAPKTA